VGCGYKYFNGGPGAPAFLYVAKRHQKNIKQPLSGWMGHRKPFTFAPEYQASEGVVKYLCGTPPILSMSVLDAALDIFDGVDVKQLREKSLALAELLITLLEQNDLVAELVLFSPRKGGNRGSQLAFQHPQAYSICQALMEGGGH
jgi:kynureninase